MIYTLHPLEPNRDGWLIFIRHNLTEHDGYIGNIYRNVGVEELYNILHNYVLDLIYKNTKNIKMNVKDKKYNRGIQ